MATARDIRQAAVRAMEHAVEHEPDDEGQRATRFICFLSGWLAGDDPALSNTLRKVVGLDPVPTKGS